MVSHKNQKKAKKPLETSLGKASTKPSEDDLSHLRKPIVTSITGIKQLLSLLETATTEVSYIMDKMICQHTKIVLVNRQFNKLLFPYKPYTFRRMYRSFCCTFIFILVSFMYLFIEKL